VDYSMANKSLRECSKTAAAGHAIGAFDVHVA